MNRHSVQGDEAAWAGALNSFTLALFKGAVGWLGGSKALVSDALFSAGEAVQDLSRMVRRKPAERSNVTESSSKARQSDSSLLLIVILFLILVWGAAQAVAVSIKALAGTVSGAPHYTAGMAAILSIGIREAAFQAKIRHLPAGENTGRLLYQHRLSMATSLLILAGVIGAMTGELLDNKLLLSFDPIAAVLAGMIVLWRTGQMLYQVSSASSSGRRQSPQDSGQMLDTIQRVYGVITVEELEMNDRAAKPFLFVQIGVSPRISMQEAAEISGRVKFLLLSRFSYIQDVEVRAVPYEQGYPYKSNFEDKDSDETLLQ
ncbi:cation transporter [Paenibacillus pinistramenti]|uniref:cation transporter n=1 Tax=Paenibacillus pinistramenti TaxID=1768003 RepID=UPI00139698DF|nr:hypothetical protein [Paenibacillus pinistramenti]